MELDSNGWPQLPSVGSKVKFGSGDIVLQVCGTCIVVRADHVRNAAGRPGGRVTLKTDREELIRVTLSQLREHANLVEDGLEQLEREARRRWAERNG
jgi:hypothetical protein